MALSFPGSPNVNQIYIDTTSGNVYQWNGTVWINFNTQDPKNIKELDNISGSFNGSNTTFALTSGSDPITPVNDTQVIISLGGVVQEAGTDYTTSGSNITFTTPPDAVLTFYGLVFGGKSDLSSVDDGSVHYYHLSSGGPVWDSSGNITISGIATIGTSSIVVNGATNRVAVGTASTIAFDSIVTTGIITAASFVGSGIGLTNLPVTGIGTIGSVNTSGIITATSFYGDGSGLTNIGGLLEPLIYTPGIGATDIATSTGIVLTYQKPITSNVGIIHLRENAIDGTIVESFDITTVGSSSTISISNATLTITPDTTLGAGTTYFVEVPVNSVKDTLGTSDSVGISSYSFETKASDGIGGTLFGWGRNAYGGLGLGDNSNRSSPHQITGTDWTMISGGNGQTLLLNRSGELWGMGANRFLGQGDSSGHDYSSPVQIPGTDWSDISSGNYLSLGMKTDGSLWAWGYYNNYGQQGQNDEIARSSPVQIPGTWSKASCKQTAAIATKTDGSLWAWGRSYAGQLGQNSIVQYSSPVQIGLDTDWNDIFTGHHLSFGIKTDGSLWSWGYNPSGQLGQNSVVQYSSPVQIPGTWSKTSNTWSGKAVLATKTDGTLWGWGNNGSGGMGINDVIPRSSPTQVGSDTTWSDPTSNYNIQAATKTDGTLWLWGYNDYGEAGNNGDASWPLYGYQSSPVQLPGTQWHRNQIKDVFDSVWVFKT